MTDFPRNEAARTSRKARAAARVEAALRSTMEAMERLQAASEALRPMREMSAEWVWLLSLCDQMRLAEVVIEDRLYGLRLQGGLGSAVNAEEPSGIEPPQGARS